jgi:diguanylate cyclase
MAEDKFDEIRQLKKNYFNLAEIHKEERDALLKVINALSLLAPAKAGIEKEIHSLKAMISIDGDLHVPDLEDATRAIKDMIVNKKVGGVDEEMVDQLEDRLIESCRIIKRIMTSILDDFYPVTEDIKKAADNIKIDCQGDISAINIREPADKLLNLIDMIKVKISRDMGDTNTVFFNLLGQVKDLEESLYKEFGGENQLREMENFETNIEQQIGSITESFSIYKTINEIRDAVALKLKKISELVSLKKKDESRKAQEARDNIARLKKKVADMEQKAQKISRQAKQFEKAAMRDGLTGLFSRGAFDLKFREAVYECREKKKSFALVMFDVDKFKSINDTLGHLAGDKVLKKVAECLEETFRKDDVIARYGGDEFVAFIWGVSEEMARERVSDFKKNLKKRHFVSHKAGEINLTVSAGISVFIEGDTAESVIERADRAMYSAKQRSN